MTKSYLLSGWFSISRMRKLKKSHTQEWLNWLETLLATSNNTSEHWNQEGYWKRQPCWPPGSRSWPLAALPMLTVQWKNWCSDPLSSHSNHLNPVHHQCQLNIYVNLKNVILLDNKVGVTQKAKSATADAAVKVQRCVWTLFEKNDLCNLVKKYSFASVPCERIFSKTLEVWSQNAGLLYIVFFSTKILKLIPKSQYSTWI